MLASYASLPAFSSYGIYYLNIFYHLLFEKSGFSVTLDQSKPLIFFIDSSGICELWKLWQDIQLLAIRLYFGLLPE